MDDEMLIWVGVFFKVQFIFIEFESNFGKFEDQ